MARTLSKEEARLVNRLSETPLSRGAATVAVILATRGHARPANELTDILAQYPGLESSGVARQALKELRDLGWITDSESYGLRLTHQAGNLRELIAERLDDRDVANDLILMRASMEPYVRVVGAMNDERVYSTYLDMLKNAQNEIMLPMLATTPHLASVEILRDRARTGVRVYALLGSPRVVASLRGETMRSIARDRISEWQRNLAGLPSAEVRVCHSVDDMRLASCMAIDGRIVRIDVYDSGRQRSLEGVMVEVESPAGLDLNLVSVIVDVFRQAWGRAQPISPWPRVKWHVRRMWKVWSGVATAAVALAPVPIHGWFELWLGIAATLLSTAFLDGGRDFRLPHWRRDD